MGFPTAPPVSGAPPLPVGAATESKQDAQIAILNQILAAQPSPPSTSTPGTGTATDSSSVAIPANPARTGYILRNTGTANDMVVSHGSTAVADSPQPLQPGGVINDSTRWLGDVSVICATGLSTTYSFEEFEP